jgi:hypothetical protein
VETTARLEREVAAWAAPFDDATAEHWLAVLHEAGRG